jgi:3-oxoacyl-[acyl-carrier protein] reductase
MNNVAPRVLITGSSSGIGRGIAEAFVSSGSRVVINGRDEEKLANLAASNTNYFPVCGDVSDPGQASTIVAEAASVLGGIDLIICNVGSGSSVAPGKETHREWLRVFGQNFFSATNIIEAGAEHLRESKGSIICISSICGSEIVPGAPITYSVAKAALNAYVKGISKSLGASDIRINAVAPGNVIFEGSVWDRKIEQDRSSVDNMLHNEVPLRRLGTVPEIVDTVIWLASPHSSFITGSVLVVDGGQTRSF